MKVSSKTKKKCTYLYLLVEKMYVFIGVKYCGSLFPQKSNKKKDKKM